MRDHFSYDDYHGGLECDELSIMILLLLTRWLTQKMESWVFRNSRSVESNLLAGLPSLFSLAVIAFACRIQILLS